MTVKFVDFQTFEGVETHAIIDHGDESFTSMPKSIYDEMIAQQELAAE